MGEARMDTEVRVLKAEALKVEPGDVILVRGPADMPVLGELQKSFPLNKIISTGTDRDAIEILRASKGSKSDQLIFDRNYLLGQIGEVRYLLRLIDPALSTDVAELRQQALEKLDRMQAWIDR